MVFTMSKMDPHVRATVQLGRILRQAGRRAEAVQLDIIVIKLTNWIVKVVVLESTTF